VKIVDGRSRTRRRSSRALLVLFVLLTGAVGAGLFNCGFLQRVRHDPKGMLWDTTWNYLEARFHKPRIDEIHLHMRFQDYEKILAKREEALRIGLLFSSKRDEVPATLETAGKKMPVKMRLKGDWPDHFETEKWSFRIRMRKGSQFRGMRRFSIQHPQARRYLGEWLFLKSMRREGILAPRYGFVKVTFNGQPKGIFAVEEHFAKELLESQQRTEGPIAKFEEDPHWRQREAAHNRYGLGWLDLDHLDFRTAGIGFFAEKSLGKDPRLREEMEAARRLLEGFQRGSLPIPEIFDLDKTARFLALCRVWGADHALIWHNLRFYYNPHTARLEPIAFDGEPWGWSREDMARTDVIDGYQFSMGVGGWFPWMRAFLADRKALNAYMRELWRISDPAWSDSLVAEYGDELQELLFALRLEWPRLSSPIDALRRGQGFFRGKLQPVDAISGEYRVRGDSLRIEVANLVDIPLEVLSVRRGMRRWKLSPPLFLASRRRLEIPRHVSLGFSTADTDSGMVQLEYRSFALPPTAGRRILRPAPASGIETPLLLPPPPDPVVFAEQHEWVDWDEGRGELRIRPGVWTLSGDLILPRTPVRIAAGTTLRMPAGSVLLARSSLMIDGSADQPVRLIAAADTTWGGLYLMQASAPSRWKHLEVFDTAGLDRPGWLVTGGVNVYGATVEISDSRFEGHRGEDAVHLIHATATLRNVIVGDCRSDALDGDFIQADLSDCSFHDVGGDAIDLSGSLVDATRIQALRIGDKAFSAGEQSHLRVRQFEVLQAGIGIASKDLSTVIAQEGTISDTRIGLAAYTKKPVFGGGTLIATHVDLIGVERAALAQTGSLIRLDGENQPTEELDVKSLYAQGVLGR